MTDSRQPRERRPYPSDLTDAQWRRVARLIPPERKRGRRRRTDMRDVVNAINYRWTTGCVWRMLPHDFPPWETVYTYFRRWQRDGTLTPLREILLRRPGRDQRSQLYGSGLNSLPNGNTAPHQLALFHPHPPGGSSTNGSFPPPRPPAAEAATHVERSDLVGLRS